MLIAPPAKTRIATTKDLAELRAMIEEILKRLAALERRKGK